MHFDWPQADQKLHIHHAQYTVCMRNQVTPTCMHEEISHSNMYA